MRSHYQAAEARHIIEKRFGIQLPIDWEPPRGGMHLYPTQIGPIIRRPSGAIQETSVLTLAPTKAQE